MESGEIRGGVRRQRGGVRREGVESGEGGVESGEAPLSFLKEWSELFKGALRQLAAHWPSASLSASAEP